MSNRSARKPTARVPRQRCGRWSNSPLPEPQNQKGLPRPLGSRRLQRVLRRRGQARRPGRRAHRDDNALHIAEAMIILPDHAGRAAAIKKALAEKGYQMSYPSIRHGLGQLRAHGEASVAEDGRTWTAQQQMIGFQREDLWRISISGFATRVEQRTEYRWVTRLRTTMRPWECICAGRWSLPHLNREEANAHRHVPLYSGCSIGRGRVGGCGFGK
jgi:hypothetical protein